MLPLLPLLPPLLFTSGGGVSQSAGTLPNLCTHPSLVCRWQREQCSCTVQPEHQRIDCHEKYPITLMPSLLHQTFNKNPDLVEKERESLYILADGSARIGKGLIGNFTAIPFHGTN